MSRSTGGLAQQSVQCCADEGEWSRFAIGRDVRPVETIREQTADLEVRGWEWEPESGMGGGLGRRKEG